MQPTLILELQKVIRFENESEDGDPFSLTVSIFKDESGLFVARGTQSDYFELSYKGKNVDVRSLYEDWSHYLEELKDENVDFLIAKIKEKVEKQKAWM